MTTRPTYRSSCAGRLSVSVPNELPCTLFQEDCFDAPFCERQTRKDEHGLTRRQSGTQASASLEFNQSVLVALPYPPVSVASGLASIVSTAPLFAFSRVGPPATETTASTSVTMRSVHFVLMRRGSGQMQMEEMLWRT